MLFGWCYYSDSICYIASIFLNDELDRIWKEEIVASTTFCLVRLGKSTITLIGLAVVMAEFRTGHLHQPIACSPLPLPQYWRVFNVAFLYCVDRCRESSSEQVWIVCNDVAVEHLTLSRTGPHTVAKMTGRRLPDSITVLLPASPPPIIISEDIPRSYKRDPVSNLS